jgi:cation diffusion facilitator CzcD-associated flavoprotein CzcO
VGIIGAGMAGLCMAATLKRAGIDSIQLYEKADSIGGTWRENTYPGVACDVPGRYYAYSFAPNPHLSSNFADGAELWSYFDRVTDELELRDHIRFGTEVISAEWVAGSWHLTTGDGGREEVDVLVCATGFLHHPRVPHIDGLDSFAGPAFHSARWDHSVSLDGKRIGVVGTGSSATQIVSALADRASVLTVFQRSAQWMLPTPRVTYSRPGRWVMRRFPILNQLSYHAYRIVLGKLLADGPVRPGWQRWCMTNGARLHLRLRIRDPHLREKLTPSDPPLCKRLIISWDYYSAVRKPAVRLVTEPIDRIEGRGVVTTDEDLHELDVLVLATGFDFQAFMRPMQITGRDGARLDDLWSNGPFAYKTVGLPGFPNLFMLGGPHSPVGNHSLVAVAEVQAKYIAQWIEILWRGGVHSVAPTVGATEAFNRALREAMPGTTWVSGCASWYLDDTGTPILWPWPPSQFDEALAQPRLGDFDLELTTTATTGECWDRTRG